MGRAPRWSWDGCLDVLKISLYLCYLVKMFSLEMCALRSDSQELTGSVSPTVGSFAPHSLTPHVDMSADRCERQDSE